MSTKTDFTMYVTTKQMEFQNASLIDLAATNSCKHMKRITFGSIWNDQYNREQSDVLVNIVYAVFLLVSFVIVVSSNMFTAMASRCSKLENTNAGHYVFGLSIAGILVGVSAVVELLFLVLPSLEEKVYLCAVLYLFQCVPFGASLLIFNTLGCDRFVAILFPMRYRRFVGPKIVFIKVWICFVVFSAISVPFYFCAASFLKYPYMKMDHSKTRCLPLRACQRSVYTFPEAQYLNAVIYFASLILNIVFHVTIVGHLRRRQCELAKIKALSIMTSNNIGDVYNKKSIPSTEIQRSNATINVLDRIILAGYPNTHCNNSPCKCKKCPFSKEIIQINRALTRILIVFVIGWGFWVIFTVLESSLSLSTIDTMGFVIFGRIAFLLAINTSFVNSVLLGWTNPIFRNTYVKILKKFCSNFSSTDVDKQKNSSQKSHPPSSVKRNFEVTQVS